MRFGVRLRSRMVLGVRLRLRVILLRVVVSRIAASRTVSGISMFFAASIVRSRVIFPLEGS